MLMYEMLSIWFVKCLYIFLRHAVYLNIQFKLSYVKEQAL